MDVVVEDTGGPVGRVVVEWLDRVGTTWSDAGGAAAAAVRVLTSPSPGWVTGDPGLQVAAAIPTSTAPRSAIADAGWFGGVGGLLAARVVADEPAVDELHVAYGVLPGPGALWRAIGPSARAAVVTVARDGGTARVDGARRDEPVGVGRRLAWFPRPVGPAHAAAVPGHEADAVQGPATVRTWLAVGSLRSELLQAAATALRRRGRPGDLLAARASRPRADSTASVRWAVVAEGRTAAGHVVRAWANGTDPVRATGALLGHTAATAASLSRDTTPPRSVVDLDAPGRTLDVLADADVLRWALGRTDDAR